MRTLTLNLVDGSSATDQAMCTPKIWFSGGSRYGSLVAGRPVSALCPSSQPVVLHGQPKPHDSKGVHPVGLNEATRYTLEEARGSLEGQGYGHIPAHWEMYQIHIQSDLAAIRPSWRGCL